MKIQVALLVLISLCALSVTVTAQKKADPKLKAFAGWLGQNKVLSKANLGVFSGSGYGGVAGTDIKEGDFVVKVPQDVLLTTAKARAQGPFPDFEGWTWNYEIFQVFILNELNKEDSFWAPYLNIMPENYDFHPLNWSDEELEELQASSIKTYIPQLRNTLKAAYEKFVAGPLATPAGAAVFPEGTFTYERYQWAYLVVTTRIWGINGTEVMVPLADMLNHHPDAGTGGLSEDQRYFVINATRDFSKGDQVFDSYGPKSNHDLLKSYGFAMNHADNKWDHMTLSFSLRSANLVTSIVEPLLRQVDPNYATVPLWPNKRPDKMLRTFRLSTMEFKELEYLNDVLQGKPATLLNELRAYRAALSSLQSLLKSYTTSVAEDEALLAGEAELPRKQVMAVRVRHSEKTILSNMILVIGKLWENILIEGTLPGGVPIR